MTKTKHPCENPVADLKKKSTQKSSERILLLNRKSAIESSDKRLNYKTHVETNNQTINYKIQKQFQWQNINPAHKSDDRQFKFNKLNLTV